MAGEAGRVIIHRGFCGSSLKSQCHGIAIAYIILSWLAIFTASLMLHRPLQFVDLTKLKTEKSHQAFHPSNDTGVQTNASYEEARDGTMEENVIEDIGAAADELEEITERFIQSVGVSAVEMMIGGFATFIVSSLLIHGIRTKKATFILPWIIETVIQTCGTFIMFLVNVSSISSLKTVSLSIYFGLSVYFILCVHSLHMIIKIQKKSVVRFLEHEFEATEVGYYRPLDNGNENPGFRDSSVWTEKTVPMTPEEDLHREHVLYART